MKIRRIVWGGLNTGPHEKEIEMQSSGNFFALLIGTYMMQIILEAIVSLMLLVLYFASIF